MSYRCKICGSVVHGPQQTVTVPRVVTATKRVKDIGHMGQEIWRDEVVPLRTEIDRQVPVCVDCSRDAVAGVHTGQDVGTVLDKLARLKQPQTQVVAPTAIEPHPLD